LKDTWALCLIYIPYFHTGFPAFLKALPHPKKMLDKTLKKLLAIFITWKKKIFLQ
jgi:hypothetical protein